MHIPFDKLPHSARIWIYTSDRPLSNADLEILSPGLLAFTESWLVHGQPINASFDIRHNRFVILAADDQTSGCSIDHSVRTMKDLGLRIQAEFLNRNKVTFLQGDEVFDIGTGELKKALADGLWGRASTVFNNLVDTKGDLSQHWIVPASDTWLKRYFPQQTVSG